jgi:hypothetical protein
MTRVLSLVGSPRGKKSASTLIGGYLMGLLEERGLSTDTLWLIQHVSTKEKMASVIKAIDKADIVVLAAPLYDDCQPFIVTKMMEEVSSSGINLKNKRFLPIINCGFGHAIHITAVSIPIYRKFAQKVGFEWAGSLAVGGGEMLGARYGRKFEDLGFLGKKLRVLLGNLAADLSGGQKSSDQEVEPPRIFLNRFFMRMGNKMWAATARKHGAAVDAKPYAS